jgi:hypothetical protein
MDRQEAQAKADRILDEERLNPTLDYVFRHADPVQTALSPLNLHGLRAQDPRDGSVSLSGLNFQVNAESKRVQELCRKARYLFLKGSLIEGLNLEVNQDKDAVKGFLHNLGFGDALTASLDEADRLFHEGGNGFTLKSSMGHLRSFLENLHKAAVPALHGKFGGTAPASWGGGLTYFRKIGVLSEAEEKFVAGLYGLISDEAVHPLFSEREYARLARNVLIEYTLLFLRKLDKQNVRLA